MNNKANERKKGKMILTNFKVNSAIQIANIDPSIFLFNLLQISW